MLPHWFVSPLFDLITASRILDDITSNSRICQFFKCFCLCMHVAERASTLF